MKSVFLPGGIVEHKPSGEYIEYCSDAFPHPEYFKHPSWRSLALTLGGIWRSMGIKVDGAVWQPGAMEIWFFRGEKPTPIGVGNSWFDNPCSSTSVFGLCIPYPDDGQPWQEKIVCFDELEGV